MTHRALTSRRGAWVSLHCCPRARCADTRPARAGIAHLMGSLKAEAAQAGAPVGVHTLSPGMVLTDLLLEGASDANKQARAWPPLALASRAPDGARDSRHPATPCARGRAGRLRCWRCPRVHAWPARELAQGGWEPYPNPPWSVARNLQYPVRAAGDGGCVPGATRAHGGRAARGRPLHPLPHRLARAGALPDRALARQPLLRRRGCGRRGAAITRPCARMRASCVSRLRLDGEGARRGRPWRAPIPPHACGRFVPRLWLERV